MREGKSVSAAGVGGGGGRVVVVVEGYLSLLLLTLCSSGLSVIVRESVRAERH